MALAFVLLESALAALRVIWSTATRLPEAMDVDRALRTSIIGGTDTNVTPVLSILQSALMLLAVLFWNDVTLRAAAYCVCCVLTLSIFGNVVALAFLRLDMHIIVKKITHKTGPHVRPIFITTAYLLVAVAVPVISWCWVSVRGKFPPMVDWQMAGLLVAAAYLLRQLLSSQAQARHQDFLRRVRRDLVLGFESPSGAAAKLAWRLSGFPPDIYVKGRFRALTSELNRVHEMLNERIGQIDMTLADLKKAEGEAKMKVRAAATEFVTNQLKGSIAGRLGMIGNSQAETFLIIAGDDAKKTEDFRKWEETQKRLEAAGKRYEKAYEELQALLQTSEIPTKNRDNEKSDVPRLTA